MIGANLCHLISPRESACSSELSEQVLSPNFSRLSHRDARKNLLILAIAAGLDLFDEVLQAYVLKAHRM